MKKKSMRSTFEINRMLDAIQIELRSTPKRDALGSSNLEDIKLLRKWKKCLTQMVEQSQTVYCGCSACKWLTTGDPNNSLNFLIGRQDPDFKNLPKWMTQWLKNQHSGMTSNRRTQ